MFDFDSSQNDIFLNFSQALVRSRLLRENGKYIPKQAFLMRRHFFNSEDAGYFKTQKRAAPATNPMTDPNAMSDMLKGNVTNVLPMIIIGGWINWAFSGFVTSNNYSHSLHLTLDLTSSNI